MDSSRIRTLLEDAQLEAAELLPDNPTKSIQKFREAFRYACAMGDRTYAAAHLAGVAVAYSLLDRRRAAIRILKFAVRYAPEWEVPYSLLGMEYEGLARVDVRCGEVVRAKSSLLQAAQYLRRASELAVLAGADADAPEVLRRYEHAQGCVEQSRKIMKK